MPYSHDCMLCRVVFSSKVNRGELVACLFVRSFVCLLLCVCGLVSLNRSDSFAVGTKSICSLRKPAANQERSGSRQRCGQKDRQTTAQTSNGKQASKRTNTQAGRQKRQHQTAQGNTRADTTKKRQDRARQMYRLTHQHTSKQASSKQAKQNKAKQGKEKQSKASKQRDRETG